MNLTAGMMSPGSEIVIGKYHSGLYDDEPIVWYKTGYRNIFYSKYVIDCMIYDGHSVTYPYGNTEYECSNIAQWLNNDKEDWFHPANPGDAPPGSGYYAKGLTPNYAELPGFLYGFKEYEKAAIVSVDLPSVDEIFEGFKSSGKGIRANPSMVVRRRFREFHSGSYIPFWTRSTIGQFQQASITRSGKVMTHAPCNACGVRPICVIKPDTKLDFDSNGHYIIAPFDADTMYDCEDDILFSFLGLR